MGGADRVNASLAGQGDEFRCEVSFGVRDCGDNALDAAYGEMDVHVWSGSLQPGQDEKSDGGSRIKVGEVPAEQAGPDRSGWQIDCHKHNDHQNPYS